MRYFLLSLLFISVTATVTVSYAQGPLLTAGSTFPPVLISHIVNAPVKEWDAYKTRDNKYYLLSFWGTWCSPCIPEMDNLSKLQMANKNRLQVIGISDDDEARKQKYLSRTKSSLWLATDTNYTLYNMLQLSSVGQCIILNPKREIIAVLMTDSVNQVLLDSVLRGDKIASNGKIKEAALNNQEDMFGLDSLQRMSFSVRGYTVGKQTMMKRSLQGPFAGRRISWINVTAGNIYRGAYEIMTDKQELYDSSVTKEEVYEFKDKQKRICLDLLVAPEEKDSLLPILKRLLPHYLPVKVRPEVRSMEVYVLKRNTSVPLTIKESTAAATSVGFSGKGYEGIKVTLKDFGEVYVANEFQLPVVDETGLAGYYDIKTEVLLRTQGEIKKSIEALGLTLEKTTRTMPVIVYYK